MQDFLHQQYGLGFRCFRALHRGYIGVVENRMEFARVQAQHPRMS